jgi:arogenate dehydrogenase (NADP+)
MSQGCKMTNLSCEEHDRLAAGSQFVTHLTGRVLGKLALKSTPINTKGFESLLALIDSTSADSFDLFYALYAHNQNSTEQLTMFAQALEAIRADLVAAKDRSNR